MGLNLKTGKLINYSKSPGSYNEPEGIFPDGKYTLVESSRHRKTESTARNIDLYILKLDSSNSWERITYFNEAENIKQPIKSNNNSLKINLITL